MKPSGPQALRRQQAQRRVQEVVQQRLWPDETGSSHSGGAGGTAGQDGPEDFRELLHREQAQLLKHRQDTCASCASRRDLADTTVRCAAQPRGDIPLLVGRCPWQRWGAAAPSETSARERDVVLEQSPPLKQLFDRVVCINLDRRLDRWEDFQRQLERIEWPFKPVERFAAVDGVRVPPPRWWRVGAAAWGCFRSHVQILEDALTDGVQSLLILEDDAVFDEDFVEQVTQFLHVLPSDWAGLMLGGQHLVKPTPINERIVQVHNANRTHAHAMRRPFMQTVIRHITDYPGHLRHPAFHVDHRLGQLHAAGEHPVYAPLRWIVGQGAGYSDIRRKTLETRFWQKRWAGKRHTG